MTEPSITYDQAEELLCERYNDSWAQDDPDWWADMIEAIQEHTSIESARGWLIDPRAGIAEGEA